MYYAYILRCRDGSFYTGYTTDLCRRVREHNCGKGSKYAYSHAPVELVHSEAFDQKSPAMRREAAIKRLTHSEKLRLIQCGEAMFPAFEEEVEAAFELIESRVEWLRGLGLRQWQNNYLQTYPLEYYLSKQREGELYVLRSQPLSIVIGTAVLYSDDPRWEGHEPAPSYYVHNLATKIGKSGAGKLMLAAIERLALENGLERIRLDCDIGNRRINDYYEALGYLYRGVCRDGSYTGNLREKLLI